MKGNAPLPRQRFALPWSNLCGHLARGKTLGKPGYRF